MKQIENAFYKAYKKRSFLVLILLLFPVFWLSLRLAECILTTIQSLMLSFFIIALLIFVRCILIKNPRILKKKILNAFYEKKQYDEFTTTIGSELNNADVKTISIDNIFICITATWFVLVTPNGSLICKQGNITKITSTFRETNSKHYLKIILSDRQSFLFPYPELEELLIEWI